MKFHKKNVFQGLVLSTLAFAALHACAVEIELPQESATYRPNALPGYQLVQKNCMTCHSAQYVQSQPPSSPRMYWEATVKKMKKPFGAQFADDEIPAIVDYLVKTYGAERSAVTASSVPAPAAKPISAAGIVSHEPHALMSANNCMACHAVDRKVVGPAFREVAAKYAGRPDALQQLSRTIRAGGAGKWGAVPMPSFSHLSDEEAQTLARHILSQ